MQIQRPISLQPLPDDAQCVFRGVVFDVYQWKQKMYDGRIRTFEKIKRSDTTVALAVTEDKKILITRQSQPGKKEYLGLVGGAVEPGEDPKEGIKRELLEETGYICEDLVLFSATQPISKIEWAIYTYVAKNCKKVQDPKLDGGEQIELLVVNFDDFLKLVMDKKFMELELKMYIMEAMLNPKLMEEFKQKLFD